MILVVEPDAKYELLTSFERRLRSRGWPTVTFCCHDLPDVIKQGDLPLREMLNVWRRLGLNDSSRPRTWWNPPDDKFLVANPKPLRPSQSIEGHGLGSQYRAVRASGLDRGYSKWGSKIAWTRYSRI